MQDKSGPWAWWDQYYRGRHAILHRWRAPRQLASWCWDERLDQGITPTCCTYSGHNAYPVAVETGPKNWPNTNTTIGCMITNSIQTVQLLISLCTVGAESSPSVPNEDVSTWHLWIWYNLVLQDLALGGVGGVRDEMGNGGSTVIKSCLRGMIITKCTINNVFK